MIFYYGFLLLIDVIFILFLELFLNWETHCYQVKTFCKKYNKGTYADFITEFNKQNWVYTLDWKNSLFAYNNNGFIFSKFHASIIEFNKTGMILNPIDYYKAKKYVKKYIEQNFNKKSNKK